MSNLKFYTIFSIFNILLILYIIIVILVTVFFTYDNLFNGSDIGFLFCLSFYILCFILKLLLPKIFVKIAKKYKNSIIGEFALTLKNKSKQKWKILLLAFCYDIPFILYWIDYDNLGTLVYALIAYLIFYAGGVLFFYIMLYREIKIKEGKIKPFF